MDSPLNSTLMAQILSKLNPLILYAIFIYEYNIVFFGKGAGRI